MVETVSPLPSEPLMQPHPLHLLSETPEQQNREQRSGHQELSALLRPEGV